MARGLVRAEAEERLRQSRAEFDQRQAQEARWFTLRLTMGWVAVPALIALFIFTGYLLVSGSLGRTVAAAALFAEAVGVVVMVWRFVLHGPRDRP